MPYKFKFKINDMIYFESNLTCLRCIGHNKNGRECSRKVCIGVPYCFQHLQSVKHLKIKVSTIPAYGKGLFVWDNQKGNDEIIFKKGDIIINYVGEHINFNTLENRYGEYTGPYVMYFKKNEYIDPATKRGIGSLVNHSNNRQKINCEFISVFNRKPQEVKIRATKDIKNHEELYINYGSDYHFNEPTSYITKYFTN